MSWADNIPVPVLLGAVAAVVALGVQVRRLIVDVRELMLEMRSWSTWRAETDAAVKLLSQEVRAPRARKVTS